MTAMLVALTNTTTIAFTATFTDGTNNLRVGNNLVLRRSSVFTSKPADPATIGYSNIITLPGPTTLNATSLALGATVSPGSGTYIQCVQNDLIKGIPVAVFYFWLFNP